MADTETIAGISAAVSVLALGIKEIGAGILRALKRRDVKDDKRFEDARADNAERDQWSRINELGMAQAKHEKDDAAIHSEFRTMLAGIAKRQDEMAGDVKTLLRRSTDQIKRERS